MRLQPALYPGRPNVSFVLQYFRQPAAIELIIAYFHNCTNGMAGAEQARAQRDNAAHARTAAR